MRKKLKPSAHAVTRRKARLDSQRGKHPHKISRKRSRAVEGGLQKEGHASASPRELSRHALSSTRNRAGKEQGVASKKSAKTRASHARPSQNAQGGAPKRRLWVRKVNTESTFPPAGVFKKDAKTIARVMATRKTSPKGIGSAIRMIQYFINRGGQNLSLSRRRVLEQAKRILQRKRSADEPT
jgi:hypothetical protein